jgi:proteasome lid subunit RPN8/RPN11
MFIDDYIKSEIKKHSISDIENECCGLVVFSSKDKVNIVFPCENKAKEKDRRFSICPKDYLKATSLGEIIAVYHSHPDQALDEFSEFDKIQSLAHGLPSILYGVKKDRFLLFKPEEYRDPYVGRAFQIDLTKFSKQKMKEVGLSPRSTFVKNLKTLIKKERLVEVSEGEPDMDEIINHDIILFKYYDLNKPSHCGVYIGGNKVLHQPARSYSRVQEYTPALRRKTYCVLRHESLAN